jgi:membrane associated rhomboid family serine protease
MNTFNSTSFLKNAAKSDVVKIIVAISIVFVILHFIRISILIGGDRSTWFMETIWNAVSMPSKFQFAIRQPWALLTFLFCDMSLMQIIGNMIWLWIFGSVLEDLRGFHQVLPIFITGGMLGACLFCFAGMLLPQGAIYFSGAMPGVSAVAMAALLYKPQYAFWNLERFSIPLWVFVAIYFALQIVSIGYMNLPYLALLLGGVIVGILYNYGFDFYFQAFSSRLQKMTNYFWNNKNFIVKENLQSFIAPQAKKSIVIDMTETKLNSLLDKINKSGIDSLSKVEKKLLEDYSKKIK